MKLTQEILIEDGVISLETAILAKNKGFSKGSKTVYIDYLDGSKTEYYQDYYTVNNHKGIDLSNKSWTVYEAPQLHVLQKWLREKHNIDVEVNSLGEVDLFGENAPLIKSYTCKVSNWNKQWSVHDGTGIVMPEHYHFDNKDYEKAFEEGLNEALKLI